MDAWCAKALFCPIRQEFQGKKKIAYGELRPAHFFSPREKKVRQRKSVVRLWICDKKSGPAQHFTFFFSSQTCTFFSFWTSRGHRCRPFSPPALAFNSYRAQGSAIPLLVDFSSSVANSRSRAFRKAICGQEKVPTNLYEYALARSRNHGAELYQARG